MKGIKTKEQDSEFVIVIPSYKPDKQLLYLVNELSQSPNPILIVNDGSHDEHSLALYSQCMQNEQVRVIHHSQNKGKGSALKTGFEHILEKYPLVLGIVTADADGQHQAKDILSVLATLKQQDDSTVVMGVRAFNKNTPRKSQIGNKTACFILNYALGEQIIDTQTGLRGYPTKLLPKLLMITGEAYDYEGQVFCSISLDPMYNFVQQPIETIYLDNNQSSHFRPLHDYCSICYKLFFGFKSRAIFRTFLEYAIFVFCFVFSSSIMLSISFAKIAKLVFNSLFNPVALPKAKSLLNKHMLGAIYTISSILFSAIIIYSLSSLGISVYAGKVLCDVLFFFLLASWHHHKTFH